MAVRQLVMRGPGYRLLWIWFSLFLFQANIPAATVTYRNLCNAVPDPEYSRVGLDACGPCPEDSGCPSCYIVSSSMDIQAHTEFPAMWIRIIPFQLLGWHPGSEIHSSRVKKSRDHIYTPEASIYHPPLPSAVSAMISGTALPELRCNN